MPRVSVLMSVWNGIKYLDQALFSIANQTYKDYEVVIIDDASTDGSPEVIEKYRERLPGIFRVVRNEKNYGLVKSLNKAIELTDSEFLARQDDDDISLPHKLSLQVAYASQRSDISVLSTQAITMTENGIPVLDGYMDDLVFNPETISKDLLTGNKIVHGTVLMRRSLIRPFNFYDESLKHVEDYDLWLRVSEKCRMECLPKVTYLWRANLSGVSHRNTKLQTQNVYLAKQRAIERRK